MYLVNASSESNALPLCSQTDNRSSICSGLIDNSNDDTHCIGMDGVIYKNIVSSGVGTSEILVGATAFQNKNQYFSFDVNGKRVDVDGNVSYANVDKVSSTYLCSVAETTKAISDCVLNGNPLPSCTANANDNTKCFDNAPINSYCIQTSDNKLLKTATENSCVSASGEANKIYYFNKDFIELDEPVIENDIKYAYICASEKGSDCSPFVIKNESIVNTDKNVLKLCSSLNDDEAINVDDISNKYLSLELKTATDFPGADSVNIDINVTKEHSIVLLPDGGASLPICKEAEDSTAGCKYSDGHSDVDVKSCINVNDNKKISLIVSGSPNQCKILTGEADKTLYSYYDENYEKIIPTENSQISYTYSCTFKSENFGSTEKKASSCTEVYGYTVYENVGISCSGLKGKKCQVHSLGNSCISSDDGKLGKNNGELFICFGTKAVNLPKKGEDDSYIAIYTKELNEYYGKFGIVLLKLTENTVSLASSDNG